MAITYFTVFHLVLWFENKEAVNKKIKNRKPLPSVTLLIPAYNEENVIERTIKNILRLNYPKEKLEVIIIDDGSKDKTYKIAKKYEDGKLIKVLTKNNGGKANTLNFGLKYAKNEYVGVVDADTFLEKNALRNCMKYFDEENVAAVTSHILVKTKNNLLEKLQNIEFMITALTRKLYEFSSIISATPGPLSIYCKDILVELGGFDENNLTEDVEIAWRILKNNYKIRMAFDAKVYHDYPSSLKVWWKQRTRWGIGGLQTIFKYLKYLFRKDGYTVGNFLVPVSIIGYVSTLVGILLTFYILFDRSIDYVPFIIKTLNLGANPFRFELKYIVDMYTILGIMLFSLSIYMIKIVLNNYNQKLRLSLSILVFSTLYLTLFPFVTIHSIYKLIKKDIGWFTK
jgi:cellulose synthase/poly-beta-1,6-N-acetylglucosamine synthase-like glycosyltransferase